MLLHKFQKFAYLLGALCVPLALAADAPVAAPTEAKKAPTKEELFAPSFLDRLSLTYGHMIQKSLNNPVVKLNPTMVIQGIQEGQSGKPSPMSEKEYEEALTLIQQYAYEDMSAKNLQEAESYLQKNATATGIVCLENGKVQYKVIQEGKGEVVTDEMMPTINYNATYSNGQKLGSSEQTGGPIEVRLDETIPGFRMGVMGMKVGEKRQIFIHPDLGYGKSGQLPNGLLIFEIEVTKLTPKPAKPANDAASDDDNDDENDNDDDDDKGGDDLANFVDTDDLMADDNSDDEVEEIEEIDIEESETSKK